VRNPLSKLPHSPGGWDETFRLLNDLRNPLLWRREE